MNSVHQKEMIRLYAKQLRLPTFNNYESHTTASADDGYAQFLIELMKQELAERSAAGQKRRIKAARFPTLKTLDAFDMARLENVSKAPQQLASVWFHKAATSKHYDQSRKSRRKDTSFDCTWHERLWGWVSGKFIRLSILPLSLQKRSRWTGFPNLKSLSKIDLLIIDELSYLTFNRYQSEMLFQIISERSERASVIISTNLEFSQWTAFENEMLLAALIDRVTSDPCSEHEL